MYIIEKYTKTRHFKRMKEKIKSAANSFPNIDRSVLLHPVLETTDLLKECG